MNIFDVRYVQRCYSAGKSVGTWRSEIEASAPPIQPPIKMQVLRPAGRSCLRCRDIIISDGSYLWLYAGMLLMVGLKGTTLPLWIREARVIKANTRGRESEIGGREEIKSQSHAQP